MKKLKINFGEGGIQGWLVRHVEKFVLVLFAGVMVWFVVSGSRLDGIKSGQTPDVLKNDAEQAVSLVNQPRWDAVKDQPERRIQPDVEKKAVNTILATAKAEKYRLDRAWNQPLIALLKKRSDPKVLPPSALKVVSISGPIALVQDERDVDPLAPIVTEDEDPKKPKKPTPKKPEKKATGGIPGMGGMAGMPGMPGMPDSGSGNKKDKNKAGSKGSAMPVMPVMPVMPGMDGGLGGGMPGMAGMGGNAGGRPIDSMIIGWRPPTGSTIRIAHANIVMALVPFEKQAEEFSASLDNSLDFDFVRDKPHYEYFAVQRADVTDDPAADPAKFAPEAWTSLSVAASLESMQTWAGTPSLQELMDPSYLMPLNSRTSPGLTQPLPPFVQRDLYDAMTHPDIPLAAAAAAVPEASGPRRPKTDEGTDFPDEIPTGGSSGPAGGSGGVPGGMPGIPGGAGAMPGMPVGGAGGMPRMPGGGTGGMPGMPVGGAGGMSGMALSGSGGMPGMPSGMPGMPGAGSYGNTEALVKYKLVRFVDQTVEQGRKYRYRVKVFLEDPNYPSGDKVAPSLAGLDDSAQVRVRGLEAKDGKNGRKSTHLQSPYSVASDVVTLPPAEWFFAGKVEPESMGPLGDGKKYPNFTRPYSGSALVVVQDAKKAVDVPAKWEIYKGSAVNFTLPGPDKSSNAGGGEVEVIHPAFGDKRKLDSYTFQTNAVIADMRGGDEIPPITGATPLKAPGEMMFVDSAGNMHVRNEVDDIEYFHRFIETETTESKQKPKDGGSGFDGIMGMPGMPEMPGGSGAPGGPAGGRPKR